jgi:hypothetical protein
MKPFFLPAAMALFISVAPVWAADTAGNNAGVLIGGSGKGSPAASNETCVDVEIAGQRAPAFDCINEKIRQQVARVQPVENIPPLQASSSVASVQSFTEASLQQQYGQNLGKSAVPFRPAPPVFAGSLGLR